MRSAFATAAILAASIWPHSAAMAQTVSEYPSHVSLLKILANPQQFHNKEVQIVGFLNLTFEGDALYLHREDLAYGILGNSIWVNATEKMAKNAKQLSKKYVIIRGVFDANNNGHMSLHSGTLTNISRCDVWADPEHPRWGDPPPPPPPPTVRHKPKK